ncbi:MAG: DMT family transporter [Betaproteobacteria bacterium]
MRTIVAQGCLALSMALVGSYVALSKPLVAVWPVFLLAWLRFGIGALAMLGWLRRPADEAPWTPATHRLLFLSALLGNVVFSICMLYGVALSSATAAGVIMSAIPAAVALLGWLWLKERISLRLALATALAVGGIALLSATGSAQGTAAGATALPGALGHLLLVGAVLCEAAYAVMGKRLTAQLSARRITALINLWALLLMTPLGLWSAWHFDWRAVPLWAWALLLFYSLAASVWSVWLWMSGLRGTSASQAGVYTAMLPISACIVGVVALGETLGATQGLALAMGLAALILATWPQRPNPA